MRENKKRPKRVKIILCENLGRIASKGREKNHSAINGFGHKTWKQDRREDSHPAVIVKLPQ